METGVSLGGKEGRTKIQISSEPGSNWGPCGRKAEILPTAPTMHARPTYVKQRLYLDMRVLEQRLLI